MFRKKKLSKYLITSALLHILIALLISRIYAQQPQQHRKLDIVAAVKIQYKEPEPPPPKPKVVPRVEPKSIKKAVPKKKENPKVKPKKVEPPKITQQARRTDVPAPGVAAENAPVRSRSAEGASALKGTRGAPGDQPGMRASAGIIQPNLTSKTGGPGLSPGLMHGSMKVPAGSGRLPGSGGKEVAGFRLGSPTGTGIGQVDIPGRGGSGGSYGRDEEGPGAGSSATGRLNIGGGKGTTGLGVGSADGMGEIDSEPGGEGTGSAGRGPGTGGPGIGGYKTSDSQDAPGLATLTERNARSDQRLPSRKELPEEKRSGATGKKEFRADLEKGMATVTQNIDEPVSRGYEDALQGEINKDLYSLRKMHEDWQNLKMPNIPKALNLTIELDTVNGKPKILKLNFNNASLAPKIVDDLTRKIRGWKFESLYDGKDDPKKWPIKLSGTISWQ